jgi:purine-nucleoside phosphorylase
MNLTQHLAESVEYIKSTGAQTPRVALILGSGLGDFASQFQNALTLNGADIPHYPKSSVHGHAGKLIFGTISFEGKTSPQLLCFQGRVHFYETNDLPKVVYPIRLALALGVKTLIVTNAAGGINRLFQPGDLMFIKDYINMTGENPLIGDPVLGRKREFSSFSPELLSSAKAVALKRSLPMKEGVYCWTKGPTYESAAEIRMMNTLGADAVGMSTVPEVMVAANSGAKVLGISCITNMATGISATKLSHEEVTETANSVKQRFTDLISSLLVEIPV